MSICKYVNRGGICILHSEGNYEEPCHEGPCPDYKPIADFEDYCSRLWKIAYERGKAEREKGEWIAYYDEDCPQDGIFKCSICGQIISIDAPISLNFCPNCGADMRGDKNERLN